MKNYEEKFNFLIRKYGIRCPIAAEKGGQVDIVTDLHHLCHNTKWRRKKFPLFIDSILNLRPVSNKHHLANGSWGKISDTKAEKYERFLNKHPGISNFVNNPIKNTTSDSHHIDFI